MEFRGETRGQSEVIGAILIFAIIVALIGINQAFVVPDANADIEFQHNNDVQRDIVDLRSGTTEAAASNEPRSRSIALGTDYPTRFVSVNPPAPTGTFQTVDGGEISADHDELNLNTVCGTDGDEPDTKFLKYQPNYNEYQNALPIMIENTVAYRDTENDPLFNTGQIFAQQSQVNIIRYVGDLEETSTRTASIDLVPSETGANTVNTSEESLNVTLPSELEASDWDRIIDNPNINTSDDGNNVEFEFGDSDAYTVRCTTVGINEDPDVNPTDFTAGGDGDGAQGINPNREGEIVLVDTEDIGNNEETATITLRDRTQGEEQIEVIEARVNHYQSDEPGGSEDIPDNITLGGTDLEIGGELKSLESPEELDGSPASPDNETEISLTFNQEEGGEGQGPLQPNDLYILSLVFSNGNVNTYFVSHEND